MIFFAAAFASAVLLGAGAAYGDGIDGFEMAGIRNQVDVHFVAAVGDVFPGCPHVVFHVARPENAAWINVFKAGENFLRRAPGNVSDDVKAPAVAHTHYQLACAEARAGIENFID